MSEGKKSSHALRKGLVVPAIDSIAGQTVLRFDQTLDVICLHGLLGKTRRLQHSDHGDQHLRLGIIEQQF